MKKILTWVGTIFISLALFAPATFAISQATPPSFSTCPNPGGQVLASYPDGTHGIVGQNDQSGSDSVYQTSSNSVVQCFCGGSSGVQTNWWKIGEMSSQDIAYYQNLGWIYVPDGSAWGLSDGAYLAQNVSGSCGGGSNNNNNNNNNGGGGSSAPSCTDSAPGGAPVLLSAVVSGANSVTLTWSKAPDPVTYYLVAYGTQPGVYPYGNPNVGNVTSYTVNDLSSSLTYYFVVRAVNGCKPGPFSNELGGGLATGFSLNYDPGVLGATSDDPIDPPAGDVKGADVIDLPLACGTCLWWPILAVFALLLSGYYFLMRNRPFTKWRWILGFGAGIVAYIVFLLLNPNCLDGVMDLKLFTLPCRLFWLLDLITYLILALGFRRFFSKK